MLTKAIQSQREKRRPDSAMTSSRRMRHRKAAAAVGLGSLAAWLIILISPAVLAAHQAPRKESAAPKHVSDMVVVSTPGGADVIYLADEESGAIYYYKVSDEKQIEVSRFERFFRSDKYSKPVGLAYIDGKLLVCDQQVPALFEIDISVQDASIKQGAPLDKPARVHLEGAPLIKPESIAISERGLIAIADDALDGITWYSPDAGSKAVKYGLDDPKIVFSGTDLVVLERESGKVFVMPQVLSLEKVGNTLTPLRWPSSAGKSDARAGDIATFNGIHYVANTHGVVAFAALDDADSPAAFHIKNVNAAQSLIAVSKHSIYVKPRQGQSISRAARPAYVNVSFRYDANKPVDNLWANHQAALVSVYEYLYSRGMLAVTEYSARDSNRSLEQLLISEKVWIPVAAEKGEKSNRVASTVREQLAALLCKLNGWPCADKAGLVLDKVLKPEEKVIIPAAAIEKSLSTGPVFLGGKSVMKHLSQRVYTEQLAEVTAQYLYRINVQYKNAESILGRSSFMPASPPQPNLSPGSILKFSESGAQILVGDLRACGIDLDESEQKKPYLLPSTFTTSSSDYKWPKIPGLPDNSSDLERIGISDIEVRYEDPKVDQLDQRALALKLESKETKDCIAAMAGSNSYLVVEAVRVAGAKYKFKRKDGSPRHLTSGDQQRLGMNNVSDLGEGWHLSTDQSFSIGYKLLRMEDPANPQKWHPTDDTGAPGLKDDAVIFKEDTGFLNLPLTGWDLSIFVNAEDLEVSSNLQRLISTYPGVFLFSKERAGVRSNSSELAIHTPPDNQEEALRKRCKDLPGLADDNPEKETLQRQCEDLSQMDEIRDNRRKLKQRINYTTPPSADLPISTIGIGEERRSVKAFHPDFIEGNQTPWQIPKGDTEELEPRVLPADGGSTLGSPRIKAFDKEADHGNHVAGLLAGRGTNGLPGLLPNAPLFLIDTGSTAQLHKSIEKAIAGGVYVFNFSFTYPSSSTIDKLKTKMKTVWYKDYLFVAAAGNEGLNLSEVVERVPVSWADDIQNIIGVAASDWENHVLEEWQPDPNKPDQKAPGTNYGKRFIHIAAPGRGVYSLASENRYAQATGSSQAVPQVTAAAAWLFSMYEYPSLVKARLIYTTDWFYQFKEKVWGGLLNFERGVFEPARNILVKEGDPDRRYEFEPGKSSPAKPVLIKVDEGEIYDNREYLGETPKRPPSIPFENILRIERTKPGEHRVIYLEELSKNRKRLRILLNASLEGGIPCGRLAEWDRAGSFAATNECHGDVDVSLVNQYVAKMPPKEVLIIF